MTEIKPSGKVGAKTRSAPQFKGRTIEIVRMKEQGMTYEQIANTIGGTRMSACYIYRRWRPWAIANDPSIIADAKGTRPQSSASSEFLDPSRFKDGKLIDVA
jgi:hypothetical protein